MWVLLGLSQQHLVVSTVQRIIDQVFKLDIHTLQWIHTIKGFLDMISGHDSSPQSFGNGQVRLTYKALIHRYQVHPEAPIHIYIYELLIQSYMRIDLPLLNYCLGCWLVTEYNTSGS